MNSIRKNAMTVLLAILLVYIGLCGLLFFCQRRLMYFPTSEIRERTENQLQIRNGTETIKVWRIGLESNSAILYFGGNAENVWWNIPAFEDTFPEFVLYLVNYRGYGGSSGTPSETGIFEDAVVVYDYVKQRHSGISVIGRSLGSGVAAYLATVRHIDKLVLVTPFDSIENVAKRHFPFLPVSWLLKDKYDSAKLAHKISSPTLLLIAEKDEVVPRERSDALVNALPVDSVNVAVMKNATHNFGVSLPDYLNQLSRFLRIQH